MHTKGSQTETPSCFNYLKDAVLDSVGRLHCHSKKREINPDRYVCLAVLMDTFLTPSVASNEHFLVATKESLSHKHFCLFEHLIVIPQKVLVAWCSRVLPLSNLKYQAASNNKNLPPRSFNLTKRLCSSRRLASLENQLHSSSNVFSYRLNATSKLATQVLVGISTAHQGDRSVHFDSTLIYTQVASSSAVVSLPELHTGRMSLQAMSSASIAQPYKTCVQVNQADTLASATTRSLNKTFSSVSLPISHPIFSSDTVDVLAPFSPRSGGIPLRTWSPNDGVTFVAHAYGEDLRAAQFEVIWQFKLFAQGIGSAAINEMTKADILTLGGTEEAPRRIVGVYTGEEHFLGWRDEHFKRFFAKYSCNSVKQASDRVMYNVAENWQELQMPKWLTAAELGGLCRSAVSALDRSLEESISITKNEPAHTKKAVAHHKDFTNQVGKGILSRSTGLQGQSPGNHRNRAIKREKSALFSRKLPGSVARPSNVYNKKVWYHATKGADRHKDRSRQTQKRSIPLPTNDQFSRNPPHQAPITSLRDISGLGAAISKTTKPYQCISARFQDKKHSTVQAPLTQPVRDFIAQKIEERMSVPAQKEAILHIIRTASPKEFDRRRNGRLIDWRNMTDRLFRELARLVSDSSSLAKSTPNLEDPHTSSTNIDSTSGPVLTPQMVHFTRENIAKLPAERLEELAYITERTVPSLDALPAHARHVVEPEQLPVENQIMIWKYVRMHLPREEDEWMGRVEARMQDDGEMGDGMANQGQVVGVDGGGSVGIDVDEDGFEIDLDVDLDLDMLIE
jgi:hypothetical protein